MLESKPKIYMVDDQPVYHALVKKALGDFCEVVSLDDGESALMAMTSEIPDLVLLDVEMPGMGGYETCRKLKAQSQTAGLPVVFLSGHDALEDRMRGYEAGGQEYITKPFDFQELKTKIQHLLDVIAQKKSLKSMADSATHTAFTVMTSMGEMGVLLQALKQFNASQDSHSIAQHILEAVSEYGLVGVVQIRTIDQKLTLTPSGPGSPLEESIIEHMSKMERIVEFKSRMAVTYDHVSLLINDMPVEDADRCGRLRDYLAPLVEAADVRVQAISAMQESKLRQSLVDAASNITLALDELDADQRLHRLNSNAAVNALMEQFESALLRVSLSDAQEDFLRTTVQQGIENITQLQLDGLSMQNKLTMITKKLNATLKGETV